MRVTITRCPATIIAESFGPGAVLIEQLAVAMGAAARVTRQVEGRIYATPTAGTVAELAERARVWLEARGHEVAVGDW